MKTNRCYHACIINAICHARYYVTTINLKMLRFFMTRQDVRPLRSLASFKFRKRILHSSKQFIYALFRAYMNKHI